MESVNPDLLGTNQHKKARDLSRYLVHLTRSEGDLISILRSGQIEARKPFGIGKGFNIVAKRHYSVCFTEMPLTELERMFVKGRKWGIVFDKERLHQEFGAQPVWYLSRSTPQLEAVKTAMAEAADDANAPIWALTPYIENVRPRSSQFPNDWRWEREWRVRGDLEFDLNDVALLIIDEAGTPALLDQMEIGLPCMAPGDIEATWSGGFTQEWDTETQQMIDRFRDQFSTPEEAGGVWDKEDHQYYGLSGELVETEDAMVEVFGRLMPALHETIYNALEPRTEFWCRAYEHASDEAYHVD